MWARIFEILLALWLLFSHFFVFQKEVSWVAFLASFVLLLFSSLCFFKKLDKMHLFNIFPIGALFWVSFDYSSPFLPMALQNILVSAIVFLIFSVIPTRAFLEPPSWHNKIFKRE